MSLILCSWVLFLRFPSPPSVSFWHTYHVIPLINFLNNGRLCNLRGECCTSEIMIISLARSCTCLRQSGLRLCNFKVFWYNYCSLTILCKWSSDPILKGLESLIRPIRSFEQFCIGACNSQSCACFHVNKRYGSTVQWLSWIPSRYSLCFYALPHQPGW